MMSSAMLLGFVSVISFLTYSSIAWQSQNKLPCCSWGVRRQLRSTAGFFPLGRPLHMSGKGYAQNYSWTEEALELEVTVHYLPPNVKAKHVSFKAKPTSVDLRVTNPNTNEEIVLLDGNRKLRGRVNLDGTFWVFSDRHRSITVTIEKYFSTETDEMAVVDYDWKGVYPNDEEEVSSRTYDEPEVLNVREYAASLGVDIDNLNRSMVDETMFSSGLNLTERSLQQLTKEGYLQEITRQADGQESIVNEEGEAEPFSLDSHNSSPQSKKISIPFVDTNSPWHNAVPVNVDPMTNQTTVNKDGLRESLRNAHQQNKDPKPLEEEDPIATDTMDATDPIDLLTVKKLKDVLRAQGLKVSGNKEELQDRLRNHVNSLVSGNEELDKEEDEMLL